MNGDIRSVHNVSARQMVPMPARARWSSSASPIVKLARDGSRRRRNASAASNVGDSRSGPRPTSAGWSDSVRCSKSSTTGASKQTATDPGTSSTSRARDSGMRHRSPGR
jgi:hypothetical protein